MTQSIHFIKPSDLRATMRGLAIMAVLFDKSKDCQYWTDPVLGADLSVWRDHKSNVFACVFLPKGSLILGVDRESPMFPSPESTNGKPWPGLFDDLPADLLDALSREPFGEHFSVQSATFCIWTTAKGLDWKKAKIEYPKREPPGDPDGAKYCLARLKQFFDHFDHEMDEQYEQSFDADTLYQVFSGEAVTAEDLRRLKSSVDLAEIREPLKAIGVRV